MTIEERSERKNSEFCKGHILASNREDLVMCPDDRYKNEAYLKRQYILEHYGTHEIPLQLGPKACQGIQSFCQSIHLCRNIVATMTACYSGVDKENMRIVTGEEETLVGERREGSG